jgi:hypothetical protein
MIDYISQLKKDQEPKKKKQYKYKDVFEKPPVKKKNKVIKKSLT